MPDDKDAVLVKTFGNLISWNTVNQEVSGKTSQGVFTVVVYSDHIFRITASQEERHRNFSYAVIAEPKAKNYAVEEDADYVVVKTAAVELLIAKNPVRFIFKNKKGQTLNEDDPSFGVSWIGGEATAYKKLQEGERFIGLGEKTGPLDRRGEAYVNWNTDYAEYPANGDPLYCTFPFYIGLHRRLAYGIFLDSPALSRFNFGASNDRFASFSVDAGPLDYYFIHGETVSEIVGAYSKLTGKTPLPPLWSLGFQQCRWSYFPDKQVLNIASTFREKNIPADVIYLDIDYMDAYKIFTWHPEKFSDPAAMIKKLKEAGFRVVTIIDPGVKVEKGYAVYDSGKEEDVFVKYPDGVDFTAKVWPGWCHFPDFTKASARSWWGDLHSGFIELGVDGFWNDMNEFSTVGQSLPHLLELDFDGRKTTLKGGKNVYGMQMSRATYEGVKKHAKGKRPFVLTRSSYAGGQRYAALWTGDNSATNEHMLACVRMVNSLGLTGVPFAGSDIGGFAKDADKDLYARWMSIGAFTPFCRVHAAEKTRPSEPWAFGYATEDIAKNYINLRYQLMPYLYSLFYEAAETGLPVARTLAIDFAFEDWVYDERYQNQYLFGPFILVAPVESHKDLARVYLPPGEWYDMHTGERYAGDNSLIVESPTHRLPLFVKAGAVIPAQSAVQHTGESTDGMLRLHVFAGAEDTSFSYYEDDGESFQYKDGHFYQRDVQYSGKRKQVAISAKRGSFRSKFDKLEFIFHGWDAPEVVSCNGSPLTLQSERFSFFKFDLGQNVFDSGENQEEVNLYGKVYKAGVENADGKIELSW